jgi:hypothetical protein
MVARWHIFKPKILIWVSLEGHEMVDVGIFYGLLVYFTAFWYILWPFGRFYGCLVCFSPLWYVVPRKIWQPCSSIQVVATLGAKLDNKFAT